MTFLASRRRMLKLRGRPMTLKRPVNTTTSISVDLVGFVTTYRPEQIVGEVRQGDKQVATLNDEIVAAAWPGPPRVRDVMVIDRSWGVQGAWPNYDGEVLIGWDIWVRGG